MAAEEQYMPDSDDEMAPDTSGDEMDDEVEIVAPEAILTPQDWKEKAGELYKVCILRRINGLVTIQYTERCTIPCNASIHVIYAVRRSAMARGKYASLWTPWKRCVSAIDSDHCSVLHLQSSHPFFSLSSTKKQLSGNIPPRFPQDHRELTFQSSNMSGSRSRKASFCM